MVRRAVSLAAVTLVGLALVPAARADTLIATVIAPTSLSAYGDRLLWSAYDPVSGNYQLTTRSGAATSAVPVAPRKVPFDADLGPDRSGATVAVYSRCAQEPVDFDDGVPIWSQARGCDLYQFDFASGRETPVAAVSRKSSSEFLPSIWKGRIAFARVRDPGRIDPFLYTASTRTGRARRVRRGSSRGCTGLGHPKQKRRCMDFGKLTPTALDLAGRRLAFAWQFHGFYDGPTYQVWLDNVAGRRGVLIAQGNTGLSANEYRWPAIDRGALYFAGSCYGDGSGCVHRSRYHRYEIATRRRASEEAPVRLLAHARSGGNTFYLRTAAGNFFAPAGDNGCTTAVELTPVAGVCTIFQADPSPFKDLRR